jgi:hypothetical protein
MLPVTSPRPKYCTSTGPSFSSAADLVGAVHRRAGIDDVAQAGMVVRVDAGCSTSSFRMVGTVNMLLMRQRDSTSAQTSAGSNFSLARPAARSARRARPAPAGGCRRRATAARRPARRRHCRRCLGHQVAQVVGDDEGHLPMRQHRRLGPAGGAGGEEEPAGIVAVDGDRGRAAPMWRSIRVSRSVAKSRADGDVCSTNAARRRRHGRGIRAPPAAPGACDDSARPASSSGGRRKFAGTQTAPTRQQANIASSIWLQLADCTSSRSPFCRP